MAPPTCALPNLAPYMAVTTYVPGMFEHNPMRAEGSEQCTRPASSSPFEPTIRFDNPVSEFLSLFAHFEPEQSEVMCASTHTTSQVMEHALQSAPEAALGRVASPPRGVGPALPGRRIAPASAAFLSFLARPSPPSAPPQARGGVALPVEGRGGPVATATGLPPGQRRFSIFGLQHPIPIAFAQGLHSRT